MRPPIYTPSGAALEYAQHGLNIYDSCPHGCSYCFAAAMAKRFGKPWTGTVAVRPGLLAALHKQLARPEWQNAGKLVHLCFTCDPYPMGHDSTATREVIRAIKESGNHVQILTKGDRTAQRDFDLLDGNDLFGVTLSGDAAKNYERDAATEGVRLDNLIAARNFGIPTWASCEPVIDPNNVLRYIERAAYVYLWRIGKLNHRKSGTDWLAFGHKAESLCRQLGRNYVIKHDLRREMQG